MTDEVKDVVEEQTKGEGAAPAEVPVEVHAPPIESRFLFVDVAAQRAKQLRRGARPRVSGSDLPHKLERLAMREVQACRVEWDLPAYKVTPPAEAQS